MIRIGIAGMGYIGRLHYEAARKVSNIEIVAAASSRKEEIQRSYPELKLVSYEALYREECLDAILICVPTFLHEEFAIQALANRRHVLCEKPLALDLRAASRILTAAKQAEVVFMVSQVLRFWPEYGRIQQLVKQGRLGEIRAVSAYRLASYPPWADWFRDPAKSGGCLFDLQVHDLDFVYWILSQPQALHTVGLRSPEGSWDHVLTSLSYSSTVVSLESTYMLPNSWPFSAGIRVAGSQGAVEYKFRSANDVSKRDQITEPVTFYHEGKVEALAAEPLDMFAAQLTHFAACIDDPKMKPVCPLEDSYAVMNLLSASRQSAETGKVIGF